MLGHLSEQERKELEQAFVDGDRLYQRDIEARAKEKEKEKQKQH